MTSRAPTVPDVEFRGKVRSNSRDTEWAAAALLDRKGDLIVADAVVRILKQHGPLTHEQIHEHYREAGGKRSENRIRTATAKLLQESVVEANTEQLGKTRSGNDAFRWQLVPE